MQFHELLINWVFPIKRDMQKYDFSTSVFTFTIPSTPCSVKWCLRNAPLHPESNKMLLEWKEHQQNSLCSPFSLQFFLLLAVTAVQKKGHLISNRNEERLSLCVLVHKCVCVCVFACTCTRAGMGWGTSNAFCTEVIYCVESVFRCS